MTTPQSQHSPLLAAQVQPGKAAGRTNDQRWQRNVARPHLDEMAAGALVAYKRRIRY